jgi:hypothetical protein
LEEILLSWLLASGYFSTIRGKTNSTGTREAVSRNDEGMIWTNGESPCGKKQKWTKWGEREKYEDV